MWTSIIVLLIGAVMAAASAFWVLRAYRRAGGGAASARPALTATFVVILIGLGVYLAIGKPELPGGAYAQRLDALKGRDPTSFTADEALAVLGQAAREHPEDPLPHLYQGQVLLRIGSAEEAARAFDAALRRDPELPEALMGMGRALVAINNGQVSPEALALFRQVAERSNDPAPWVYQAMAAMQQDNQAEARRYWREALTRMSPDDPRREMARRMIEGE